MIYCKNYEVCGNATTDGDLCGDENCTCDDCEYVCWACDDEDDDAMTPEERKARHDYLNK